MAAPNETMMISDIINGIRKISSSETKNIFLNKTDGEIVRKPEMM